MKILHLMPYCPVPPTFGGALRIYHLLKNLAEYHEVTVATYGTEHDRKAMIESFGGKLRAIHMIPSQWTTHYRRIGQLYALCTNHSFFHLLVNRTEMQRLIDRVLAEEEFDIVQTEFPMMGAFRLDTDAVRVLDAHNVEYENFRRMWLHTRSPLRKAHYYREYKKLYDEEIAACKKQDAMFVTSQQDREIFDTVVPSIPKFIIPNGVDTSYFHPFNAPPEEHSLVFTGMMAYTPNYDGMVHFLDAIFPLILKQVPDAKIYIVGSRPPRELLRRVSSNVIVTGYVEDVRLFVARSSVYVVPLRMGSGTRLKVLEAMAMKKPIVTTSIGCEGIDVVHGENVFIEDEPTLFAKRVVQLFRDASLRQRLVERGYEFVRSQYEWSLITQTIEQVYTALVEHVHGGTTRTSRREDAIQEAELKKEPLQHEVMSSS